MGPFHQSDSINPPLEVYDQISPDSIPAQSFFSYRLYYYTYNFYRLIVVKLSYVFTGRKSNHRNENGH